MESYYLGNGKRWVLDESCDFFQQYHDKNMPDVLCKLLLQRNIKTNEEAQAFLNSSLKLLFDPFLLEGMDVTVERILHAIENKNNILIYGDYDVDGVSATAIMVNYFKSLNSSIDYYIPDRLDEGYGITDAGIDYICSNNFDLVITVDCGITARFQIEAIYDRCSKEGKQIDIIITDHHQSNPQFLPEAFAIINPHLPESKYPFKNLCGAGLALKLVQAISQRLNSPQAYIEYLDLAALATIADIVELTGENRIITKYGIRKIIKKPCVGIKALLDIACAQQEIDSYKVAFALAPRVNAAGRMGDAKLAVKLFTTDDTEDAEKIAVKLNELNLKRQEVQEGIFNSAVEVIESDPRYKSEKVLVVYGKGWHHGVIGIVASKIVDKYHKPTFILSCEDNKAVGSGRSIEGFNLFEAMDKQSDLLIKFGGHEQAGGLTLMVQDIELFRTRINNYAENIITNDMLIPKISVNLSIGKDDISLKTAKLVSMLEPFGAGNPLPIFCFKGAVILSKKPVGNSKHLKLTLDFNGLKVEGVYFGKGYLDVGLFIGDKVDVAFTQEINTWQNKENLQIKVWDMHLDEASLKRNQFMLKAIRQVECLDCDDNCLYNGIINKIVSTDDISIDRDVLAVIYRNILRMDKKSFTLGDFFVQAKLLANQTKKNLNCFKYFVAMLVFDELGLVHLELDNNGMYNIIMPDDAKKVSLENSEILDWMVQATQGF